MEIFVTEDKQEPPVAITRSQLNALVAAAKLCTVYGHTRTLLGSTAAAECEDVLALLAPDSPKDLTISDIMSHMGFGQPDRESLSVAQQENLRYFEKWEATSICGELCIHMLRTKELDIDIDQLDWPELVSEMEVICLS
jgi:hypothetical protein